MNAEIYLPASNTSLEINVADDTVIEAAEKLEIIAELLRMLAHADADEDGNVKISRKVECIDLRFKHEEWDEDFSMDSPLILSVLTRNFKSGHSKSTVGFCKDFADFAKTGKTFAEFGREKHEQLQGGVGDVKAVEIRL